MERFERHGLTFDVTDLGPADGPAVVLLHGFPQDRTSWDGVAPALAAAGRRVLVPDQRGYSPGARPRGRRCYRVDELGRDVLAMADAAGVDTIDVVGHDWGAVVAWDLAARHPRRVRTLTALSVPHPRAFLGALRRGRQAAMSWYMLAFQVPGLPERLLADPRRMAGVLTRTGLPAEAAARYAARADTPAAVAGMLAWYRALPTSARHPTPPVEVPTLYCWGDRDVALGRDGAEACGRWVRGPYTYEVLAGAGHWLPETRAGEVADLVLAHLRPAA